MCWRKSYKMYTSLLFIMSKYFFFTLYSIMYFSIFDFRFFNKIEKVQKSEYSEKLKIKFFSPPDFFIMSDVSKE